MEILAEVEAWARNPDAPNVLWIKAAPGAGKSTITSTLFTTLEIKIKRLGAGYFLGRQDTATQPPARYGRASRMTSPGTLQSADTSLRR